MKKKEELTFKIKVPHRLGLALHHWKIHFVVFAFMLLSFFMDLGQTIKVISYSPSLSAWYVGWVRNNQVIYLPIWNVHCKSCVKLAEKDSEKKQEAIMMSASFENSCPPETRSLIASRLSTENRHFRLYLTPVVRTKNIFVRWLFTRRLDLHIERGGLNESLQYG